MANGIAQRLFLLTDIQIQRHLKDQDGLGQRRSSSRALIQGMGKGRPRLSSTITDAANPEFGPLDDSLTVNEMFDF